MDKKITGSEFATQAMSDKYTGIPYKELDCQDFVEQVLKDCGVRNSKGQAYNWKGSNDMWRNALSWKGTIDECRTRYGSIPVGAWMFIVKRDGGEKERGYNDDQGNASHVAIYCRDKYEQIRDSTKTSYRNGVGYRDLVGFTHVGLPKMIIYNEETPSKEDSILSAVAVIRNKTSSDDKFLEALKTLTKYLIGG